MGAAYLKTFSTFRRIHKCPYFGVIGAESSMFIKCAHGSDAVALVVFSSSLFRRERKATNRLLETLCRFHCSGSDLA